MATISIGEWAKKSRLSLDEAARGIKISLFSGVIRDTRVDTGRLRGNWQTTTGSGATGIIDRMDTSGSAATTEVQATVGADTVDYITNNLPYARIWNERDAIIDKNLARLQQNVRTEVAKAKK